MDPHFAFHILDIGRPAKVRQCWVCRLEMHLWASITMCSIKVLRWCICFTQMPTTSLMQRLVLMVWWTQDVCIYPPAKPSLESALFLFLYMDFNFLTAFTHVFCWYTGFMQEIPNKVMSVDYSDFKAEIKMVDSQESLMGGVLMMVNGSLSISQDI